MTRLFDAGSEAKQQKTQANLRDEVRRRSEEADQALREAGFLDDKADKLGATLASRAPTTTVQSIRYKQHRAPGSRWLIEHAQVGADYVFQAFPLRPSTANWQDVIGRLIHAMDVIYPRSVQIRYTPPDETFQVKFFTIRVENLAAIPGWLDALERTLTSLANVDVWT